MKSKNRTNSEGAAVELPAAERVQQELVKARSMDDFFGRDGIFANLFAQTLEQMLEAELSEHLGYEPYEARGRNTGNSRNGRYPKKVRTSTGETTIQVPRDRNGSFTPQIVQRYAANTNEREEKILGLYARGMSTRDIRETLAEAETNLLQLGERWGDKYAIAIRSWENNWSELSAFFDFPAEIRRLIYTTNTIEGYNRQLRKVIKTKGSFPTAEAARKLLYLATVNITKTWTRPMYNWPKILNQLAIRFEQRLQL